MNDNINAIYRQTALKYLNSKVEYFNIEVDYQLDFALRSVSNLPIKPEEADNYSGILGVKSIVEQRYLCLKLLKQRLIHSNEQAADLSIDKAIRLLNNLPTRVKGVKPYVRLFTLESEDTIKPEKEYKYNINPENLNKLLPAKQLSINIAGIELIKNFEGYRECTYKDPGSADGRPYTGGYGSTRLDNKPLQLNQCYEEKIWSAQLIKDIAYFEDAVRRYVKVPITSNMFSSLVCITYNIGAMAFSKSTFLTRLNNGDPKGCTEAMGWWIRGGNGKPLPGLIRRRQAEVDLFIDNYFINKYLEL